jgi:hypothetical protein
MAESLFHLSPTENREKILSEGIKANKAGEIFVFTDLIVCNEIAKNQVGADHYDLFRIYRRGITGAIERDNVAEFSASFQRIIKQDCIKPRFLKFEGDFETIHYHATPFDYFLGKIWGLTFDQVDEKFEFIRRHYIALDQKAKT